MGITGLGNLAVKVSDLDAAVSFYEQLGATVSDRGLWLDGERADAYFGPVQITLFTRAIYEEALPLPSDGFLHVALFTDDLDSELAGRSLLWGPEEVTGVFGRRRIAFVEAPGNMRIEFMEQLDLPPTEAER